MVLASFKDDDRATITTLVCKYQKASSCQTSTFRVVKIANSSLNVKHMKVSLEAIITTIPIWVILLSTSPFGIFIF